MFATGEERLSRGIRARRCRDEDEDALRSTISGRNHGTIHRGMGGGSEETGVARDGV